MSRSYRYSKIFKDSTKGMKRFANKKVRKNLDLPNGNGYKKVFESYDISDYKFICTDNCKICDKTKCDYRSK